jgi:hypothetical protein
LLPFSSEYFMFSSINLTLFWLFCVGVIFGFMHQKKKLELGVSVSRVVRGIFDVSGR